ncbi:hypothetical protein AKJ09_06073 [Labilithrix luteola]|uniref:4-vinyl reductase 4VR domain-containing protein n=1 Tax=Labilithrix luteola TaxID=1391654 RepID=A0A0K1Q208_9BACT|nr:hypothetical protein [Labilithrix luteola]AKU99409.1 hypothetical protein AKJ09_06073 [Labilithrix luteola]
MKAFDFSDTSVCVSRSGIAPLLAAFGAYQARGERVIKRHLGVEDLHTGGDGLYPVPRFLEAIRELQEQFGPSFIHRMGVLVFEKSTFPPGLDSAAKVLASLDHAFHMNHPNARGKLGGYHWTSASDGRGSMVCDTPYPCSLDAGILEGVLAHFSTRASVSHDEAKPCRAKGGESCTYLVEW